MIKKDGEATALDLDTSGETVIVTGGGDYPPAYFFRSIAATPADGTLWAARRHLGVWIVRDALDSLNKEDK